MPSAIGRGSASRQPPSALTLMSQRTTGETSSKGARPRSAEMQLFTRLAHRITAVAGSLHGMVVLVVALAAWVIWGVAAHWNRPWELAVALGAPILTLFMLILLQHAQNREAQALQLKLNELILALREPDARVVDA